MSENRSLQSATDEEKEQLIKRLKRPSYNEMENILSAWARATNFFTNKRFFDERSKVFHDHGWTEEEYFDESVRILIRTMETKC